MNLACVIPQDLSITASPEFVGLTLSGLDVSAGVYTDVNKALTSTAPTTGILGYWSKTGTILSPDPVITQLAGIEGITGIGPIDIHAGAHTGQLVLNTDGNIGLGTDTPGYKLDIQGTLGVLNDITALADINLSTGQYINLGDTVEAKIGWDTTHLDIDTTLAKFTADVDIKGHMGLGTDGVNTPIAMLYGWDTIGNWSDGVFTAGTYIDIRTTPTQHQDKNIWGMFSRVWVYGTVGYTHTGDVIGMRNMTKFSDAANYTGKVTSIQAELHGTFATGGNFTDIAFFRTLQDQPTSTNRTVTNAYGLYVCDIDFTLDGSGGRNYAIRTNKGHVKFGETLNVVGVSSLAAGTIANVGLNFGEVNTGIWHPSSNVLSMVCGGIAIQSWSTTGVGITGTLSVTGVTTLSSGNVRKIQTVTGAGASPDLLLTGIEYTILLDGNANTCLVNLDAVPVEGQIYNFKCVDATNACTVGRNGKTIDRVASDFVLSLDECVSMQADSGGNWEIVV